MNKKVEKVYIGNKYVTTKPCYYQNGSILEIPNPWSLFNNKLIGLICHLHLSPRFNSHVHIPFQNVWLRQIFTKKINTVLPLCVIVNAHFYNFANTKMINYVKKTLPGSKVVLFFPDKYEYFEKNYIDFPAASDLLHSYDLVVSYNIEDVKKYGFLQDRPCFPRFPQLDDNNDISESDLLFVGRQKGRLKLLYKIYEICTEAGLKCDFFITEVPDNEKKYTDDIHFNQSISYSEVLQRVKKTKCIVNLMQEGASGITLRDYEALFYNKMLLTDNKVILNSPFYSDEQIIMLDDLDSRIDDIRCNTVLCRDFSEEFSKKKWYEWITNELSKKGEKK